MPQGACKGLGGECEGQREQVTNLVVDYLSIGPGALLPHNNAHCTCVA